MSPTFSDYYRLEVSVFHRLRFAQAARVLVWCAIPCILGTSVLNAAEIDRYFEEFANQWVRNNPDQAVATRYFSGEQQIALERQLTPQTADW
jgi:hypothetical protein